MSSNSYFSSFEQAADAFRDGSSTPRAYLDRLIEATGLPADPLQVFARLDLEAARRMADASTLRFAEQVPLSPIDGMPIGIKDIIHTSALPTGMGSALYEGWQPRANAAAVDALLEAGAVILGKTHTTEFAMGRATVTCNPHDPSRSPGGSSSGSAAGVASGMMCAALGTQTQGSIIRPASYCGVVGYKPTWGMLPLEGIHMASASHDHLGVIAQSIELAWRVAHCIADWMPGGISARLPGGKAKAVPETRPVHRLALLQTAGYQELDVDEQSAFEAALGKLELAGIEVVRPEADPSLAALCKALDEVPAASADMVARDMIWPYAEYCRRDKDSHVSGMIRDIVQRGRGITKMQYQAYLELRATLQSRLAELADQYDAFVLPSSSGVAPKGLENTGSRTLGVYASFLGAPAVSLPVLSVGGLPMGLQLVTPPLNDYALLCRAMHVNEILKPIHAQRAICTNQTIRNEGDLS